MADSVDPVALRVARHYAGQRGNGRARRLQILHAIHVHQQDYGHGATIRQLCLDVGLASTHGAHQHVQMLITAGLVARDPQAGLVLTPHGDALRPHDV